MFSHIQTINKLPYLALVLLSLQSCISLNSSNEWPQNIPAQEFFSDYCKSNSQSCLSESNVQDYLLWVKRFYLGSILYPTGWLEMTQLVAASLDNETDKQVAKQELDKLGQQIVKEWAKKNSERLINSQNIATWGQALRTSAENGEQIEFITKIKNDVADILSKTLQAEEISRQRYYPADDYDNF